MCKLSEPMWKVEMKKIHAINIVCVCVCLYLYVTNTTQGKKGLVYLSRSFESTACPCGVSTAAGVSGSLSHSTHTREAERDEWWCPSHSLFHPQSWTPSVLCCHSHSGCLPSSVSPFWKYPSPRGVFLWLAYSQSHSSDQTSCMA